MFRASQGFTLIELMIVVAIVGILSSIALPEYHNYTIRARVTEGISLASSAQANVADILAGGNALGSAAGYGLGWVAPSPTTNVNSVAINAATGVITITMVAAAGNGTLTINPYTSPGGVPTALPAGDAPFNPPSDALLWQCRAAGSTAVAPGSAAGTLLTQYAPNSCR